MKLTSTRAIALALVLVACSRARLGAVRAGACALSPNAVLGPADATVVMRGLNNPRGLAFGPNGALFVAEAGRGGSGPCFQNAAGGVLRTHRRDRPAADGVQDTVVSGLPSYANSNGRAEGPNSISLLGMGGAYVTIGLETDPTSARRPRSSRASRASCGCSRPRSFRGRRVFRPRSRSGSSSPIWATTRSP